MSMFKHILAATLLLPGLALAAVPAAAAVDQPRIETKGKPDDLAPPAASGTDDWSAKPEWRGKADPKPPKALAV